MFRKRLSGSLLAAFVAATSISAPARAQMSVIDSTNLVQNALVAARTLEQINNQITSLQNEATNLMRLGKTFAPQLLDRLNQIDALMQQAKLVALRVQDTRDKLDALYKGDWSNESYLKLASNAKARIDASREALRNSLILQAQVTEQIQNDQDTLKGLADANQGAEGGLAAQQATNEILSFQAAQNLRLQALLVAQSRADAIEQARQMEVLAASRTEHKRFFESADAPYAGARPWN